MLQVGPLFLTHCEYECPEEGAAGVGRLRAGRGRHQHQQAGDDEEQPTTAMPMPGEPPHICVPDKSGQGARMCHVFTGSGAGITVNASLQQADNPDADQSQWCNYPIGETPDKGGGLLVRGIVNSSNSSTSLPHSNSKNCLTL